MSARSGATRSSCARRRGRTRRRSARSSASPQSTTTPPGHGAERTFLYVFSLGRLRVAHLGDLGHAALRDAQMRALGRVDLLLLPVGGGPTIGAEQAAAIAEAVGARIVVPAHYRTERIDFLEPVDGIVERFGRVHRADAPLVDLDALPAGDGPLLVVPAVP